MAAASDFLTDNLHVWTSAIERRSLAGRLRSRKSSLYGIQKLRALILELAVRGKLVPQDWNDEPASELLNRIKREQGNLTAAGKIGKQRNFNRVLSAPPFKIPPNWVWVQISDIGHDWGQKTPTSEFTYIDVGSIDQHLGRISEPSILEASSAPSRARKRVCEGTVIFSTVRPYLLNIAIIDQVFDPEPIASTAFAVIHPFSGVLSCFVYRYLRSPPFVAYVEARQTGIAYPAINDKQFFSAPFPLPPLTEQHRIVAKVDELMVLCDRLEAETYEEIEAHELLVANLLATLRRSQIAEELAENWACVEAHFDTLFTTEGSIDQLKQTILQLAMMGKLVPQDPNDEPASDLLRRVLNERVKQSKQRSIRGDFIPPAPDLRSFGWSLPDSWVNCTLGQISIITDPNPSHRYPDYKNGTVPILSTQEFDGIDGWNPSSAKLTTREFWEFQREHCAFESGDIVFARKGRLGLPRFLPEIDSFTFSHTVFIIKPMPGVLPEFMLWLLRLDSTIDWLMNEMNQNTGVPTLGKAKTERLPIALPPFAEQKRIVAKIEQLFRFCDEAKDQLGSAKATQLLFANAVASKAAA